MNGINDFVKWNELNAKKIPSGDGIKNKKHEFLKA